MNNSSKLVEFLYTGQNKKLRVDSYLANYADQYSRSYIKKLIIDGFLSINSKSIKDPSFKLSSGDKIELYIPPGPRLGANVINAEGVSKSFGDKLLLLAKIIAALQDISAF